MTVISLMSLFPHQRKDYVKYWSFFFSSLNLKTVSFHFPYCQNGSLSLNTTVSFLYFILTHLSTTKVLILCTFNTVSCLEMLLWFPASTEIISYHLRP